MKAELFKERRRPLSPTELNKAHLVVQKFADCLEIVLHGQWMKRCGDTTSCGTVMKRGIRIETGRVHLLAKDDFIG
mgnify:CR=1 FL=1